MMGTADTYPTGRRVEGRKRWPKNVVNAVRYYQKAYREVERRLQQVRAQSAEMPPFVNHDWYHDAQDRLVREMREIENVIVQLRREMPPYMTRDDRGNFIMHPVLTRIDPLEKV